jgi:hypothetical protein
VRLAYRLRGRIQCQSLQGVFRGAGYTVPAHRAILTSSEWRRRAVQSDGDGSISQHAQGEGPPGHVLGEAVMTTVYILNRSSLKGASGRTPYELWIGSTPSIHHLRTFRCVAHVKGTRPHLRKLNDRSKPMIFVDYESGLPRL